jgi:hypothetical protein
MPDLAPIGRPSARPWTGRRWLLFALLGGLATLTVVLGGQPPVERRPGSPVRWPVLDVHGEPGWLRSAGPLLAVCAAGVLVVCWLLVLLASRRGRLSVRRVLTLAAAWSVPLLVGPPALSADGYDYLAIGAQLRRGLDPYRAGAAALGHARLLGAVDPRWRAVRAPYGPVGLLVDRFAALVGGSSPVAGVLTLRAVAVAGVVLLVGASLAGHRRAVAAPAAAAPVIAALVAANPVVLLHLVGPAHLDAVVAGLLAAAWWTERTERPGLAVALATAAGLTKAPALVAVAALVLHRWGAGEPGRVRVLARQLAAAGLVTAGLCLAVPDGLGWLRTLSTPGLGRTTAAPGSALAAALTAALGTSATTTLSVCRIGAEIAGALAVLALLATARRREAAATAGWALIAITLAAPVAYVWYLAAPLACLVGIAGTWTRRVLVALCVAGSATSLPSLRTVPEPWPAVAAAAVAVAVAAAVAVSLLRRRGRLAPTFLSPPLPLGRRVSRVEPAGAGPPRR